MIHSTEALKRIGQYFVRVLAYLVFVSSAVVLLFRFVPVPVSSYMVEKKAAAVLSGKKKYKIEYQWASMEKISPNMCLAVVAAEDQEFPSHYGFDFSAMRDAAKKNSRSRRVHGASTITQQVAKNLFLWPQRSYVRKGLEAYFTVLLELLWSKHRILEVYLNIAEMGNGVFGVTAASRAYFGKSPAYLSFDEAALLASVLPNPVRMHANFPSEYVEDRQQWIIGQMCALGGTGYLKGIVPEKEKK